MRQDVLGDHDVVLTSFKSCIVQVDVPGLLTPALQSILRERQQRLRDVRQVDLVPKRP